MRKLIFILFAFVFASTNALAAVGCDLTDPDRDVKRLFPDSTGYKTAYYSLKTAGGEAALKEVESLLGDNFTGTYETVDVPYTVYTIYKGDAVLGFIHGINQKGQYGGIQVFLLFTAAPAKDNYKVAGLYFQKLTSRDAKALKDAAFTDQFKGLTFADFEGYSPVTRSGGSAGLKAIGNPLKGGEADMTDFYATLRAIKKNMILLRVFKVGVFTLK